MLQLVLKLSLKLSKMIQLFQMSRLDMEKLQRQCKWTVECPVLDNWDVVTSIGRKDNLLYIVSGSCFVYGECGLPFIENTRLSTERAKEERMEAALKKLRLIKGLKK